MIVPNNFTRHLQVPFLLSLDLVGNELLFSGLSFSPVGGFLSTRLVHGVVEIGSG